MVLAFTRRLCRDADQEMWLVHYCDVHVGSIGIRQGVPVDDVDRWGWACGLYPMAGAVIRLDSGTAANFARARRDFGKAWEARLPTLTGADFETWRFHRDFAAWKYAMHNLGRKLPTDTTAGVSQCFCGATITSAGSQEHVLAAHRMTSSTMKCVQPAPVAHPDATAHRLLDKG
jgi:hypothetical protein